LHDLMLSSGLLIWWMNSNPTLTVIVVYIYMSNINVDCTLQEITSILVSDGVSSEKILKNFWELETRFILLYCLWSNS
jgi:hypothetical protein